MADTNFITKTNCEKCGSKDNVGVWETEEGKYHGYCFSQECEAHYNWNTLEDVGIEGKGHMSTNKKSSNPSFKGVAWKTQPLEDRAIMLDAVQKFQIKTGSNGEIAFPFYNKNGEVDWVKYRTPDKDFKVQKKSGANFNDALLFGQNLFPAGKGTGKFKNIITIVEGEFDAASAWELLGQKGSVVSLKNGAQSVKQSLKNPDIYEYLNSFDTIVVCFDNDEAGKSATKTFCSAFHPKKLKLFPHQPGLKDANDYLMKGLYKKFTDLWWKSEPYKEDGIIAADTLIGNIVNKPPQVCYSYPWEGLNEKTYGCRMTEMVTITAMTGVGKTQILREFDYGMLTNPDPVLFTENLPDGFVPEKIKVGILSIEEDPEVSLEGLASLHLNKKLHLPDVHKDPDEVTTALKEIVYDEDGEVRLYFYDQFGSNEIENIINKIWFMAKGLDCNVIVLDHINMVVSDQRQEDERRALDEIATKLKQMTKDLKINLHVVAHQNRDGKIRGTAAIEQLSNTVIFAERDIEAENEELRNTTSLSIQKCRFSGKTGPAGWLYYDDETGRMIEVDDPIMEV